jgi:hypothetical protein
MSEILPSCHHCPEVAPYSCARCELVFCMEHAPMPEKRCLECEAGYHDRKSVLQPFFNVALLAAVAAFVYFWTVKIDDLPPHAAGMRGITTGSKELDFTILCILGALFTGSLLCTGIRYVYRRRFLAERTRSPSLPAEASG